MHGVRSESKCNETDWPHNPPPLDCQSGTEPGSRKDAEPAKKDTGREL